MAKRNCTDMVGRIFGRLEVLSVFHKNRKKFAFCQCSCGKQKAIYTYSLVAGDTRSCGCLSDEVRGKRTVTHGETIGGISSTEHSRWNMMRQRCLNPKNHQYPIYGGRGIKVCERWKKFENFLANMGRAPAGMSLDRIDCDGPYEPSNCRWATAKTQARNQRNKIRYEFKGKSLLLCELAELSVVSYDTLKRRIYTGWTVEEAVCSKLTQG